MSRARPASSTSVSIYPRTDCLRPPRLSSGGTARGLRPGLSYPDASPRGLAGQPRIRERRFVGRSGPRPTLACGGRPAGPSGVGSVMSETQLPHQMFGPRQRPHIGMTGKRLPSAEAGRGRKPVRDGVQSRAEGPWRSSGVCGGVRNALERRNASPVRQVARARPSGPGAQEGTKRSARSGSLAERITVRSRFPPDRHRPRSLRRRDLRQPRDRLRRVHQLGPRRADRLCRGARRGRWPPTSR